jgi:hypothetical protein
LVFGQVALVRILEPAQQLPFTVRLHDERALIQVIERAAVEIEKVKPADLVRAVV